MTKSNPLLRTSFFAKLALLTILAFAAGSSVYAKETTAAAQEALEITVYSSPTCSCCHRWIEVLEKDGFKVSSHSSDDMNSVKQSFGLKPHLASCHTATIGGYVIEGHVPAADIRRLLKEKPQTVGLTAPGMPRHSPGMQAPGEQPKGYDVLSFDRDGNTTVFTKY
ncbi:MAG: DUF411 domain-containing protein [Xanthomonadales bacterium]|nr:DUF411 domain-containing protein [Xanthomonadales bacterium]